MATTKRKCAKCKGTITIDKANVADVIYYNKLYYHEQCFCDLCTQRIEKKKSGWRSWREALDDIEQLKKETRQKVLQSRVKTDPLNDYLLEHYDVVAVPSNFWTMVADLGNGIYRSKRCKPIDIDTLLEVWKWGQGKLDKIAQNNRANHKGPSNDTERLRYDLAILMGHIEDFKKYKAREESQRTEIIDSIKNQPKIDYSSLSKCEQGNSESDVDTLDMNELINQIF